jgi:hypothetical protein
MTSKISKLTLTVSLIRNIARGPENVSDGDQSLSKTTQIFRTQRQEHMPQSRRWHKRQLEAGKEMVNKSRAPKDTR